MGALLVRVAVIDDDAIEDDMLAVALFVIVEGLEVKVWLTMVIVGAEGVFIHTGDEGRAEPTALETPFHTTFDG